jgi:oxygen-independent coproporphyrinogen III oxidase
MLGIYLHIPFCSAICSYCNFNRGLFDAPLKARYVEALAREIGAAADGTPADTVFFGGGTPSLLEPAEIGRLISACRDAYALTSDAEITLETNPETATPDRLAAVRAAGVNRISFGVQSFDDAELKRLGRIHSADRAAAAVREARAAGFTNLSVDLMLWLPGQSKASWLETVHRAVDLAPDHLSLYLLELYPNAPLKEAMARVPATADDAAAWAQASDDEAADMYLAALEQLDEAGLVQYEISNVARSGYWSRHNVKYWQGGEWRGFGCGAHSTAGGARWKNVASTSEYIEAVMNGREIARDRQTLSSDRRVEEALFTGLRLTAGINLRNFLTRYGVDPWTRYGEEMAPYVQGGWIWKTSEAFGLTRPGMLVANEILATFV